MNLESNLFGETQPAPDAVATHKITLEGELGRMTGLCQADPADLAVANLEHSFSVKLLRASLEFNHNGTVERWINSEWITEYLDGTLIVHAFTHELEVIA
jgi:hypothetical protein